LDCNRDHVNDSCEVQREPGSDANGNHVLDACETLAALQDCLSGPGTHTAPRNPLHDTAFCRQAFDLDHNAQVDLRDWVLYLAAQGQ
jgi:hypothetical protein